MTWLDWAEETERNPIRGTNRRAANICPGVAVWANFFA
jgi:hypothetical protein